MKTAHITNRPRHLIGDRVLGLCGKKFKVKVLWEDIPEDHPVCRDCIDAALKALTEADEALVFARSRVRRLVTNIQVFEDVLGANLLLDQIADADTALQKAQIEKAEAKAEEKQAKKTCICVWESPEMSVVNPACPVHGGDQPAAIS